MRHAAKFAYWAVIGALTLPLTAFAYPAPIAGTENIPALMQAAKAVCRGEVVSAPEPSFVNDGRPRSITAIARVRFARCYKGDPGVAEIGVLFDSFTTCCGPAFVLRAGDYYLFFLKPNGANYEPVDDWFGALTASKLLANRLDEMDAAYQLELDLKAGLEDSNEERVLDNIRMLGNMGRLRSKDELFEMARSSDPIRQTYAWQALLRLHDTSVLPTVTDFLLSRPRVPKSILMPRDRIFYMQSQLTMMISGLKDPSAEPFLTRLSTAGDPILRREALQALRSLELPDSVPVYLHELDDHEQDNDFSAMQALLALAGGGAIGWVPDLLEFRRNPALYSAQCRQWWENEGQYRLAARTPRVPRFH